MWPTSIGEVVRAELGPGEWDTAEANVKRKYGLHGAKRKNGLLIGATVEALWNTGLKSESLDALCRDIVLRGATA
jgi:hypothetical protein